MRIKWLGHSCFVITSDSGLKIMTDPYLSGGSLSYGKITEAADIVTVSHDHSDHNNVAAVSGNPEVVRGSARVKGIEFRAISSYHDEAGGRMRGSNTIFCFEVDGIAICHLGDLGHVLDDKQVAGLGGVDILLIPVGGYFTIDVKTATYVCERLQPRVVIPMHFKNERCGFPIAGVDEFLGGKSGVSRLDKSELEFEKEGLPAAAQIIVLKPQL
ncbi:MAG: MBL fold metallo-hydrolase [Dehalococcoidia bacterium]|nr:MAG: MBL fold metallo-hydrolase [Dehalococcoidia bacterium]